MNESLRIYEKIQDDAQLLGNLKDKLLRKQGWDHRCGFPGGYWLWCKTINGALVATTRDLAVDIESHSFDFDED